MFSNYLFPVRKVNLFFDNGLTMYPIRKGYKGIMREDNNKLISIVKDTYKLVSNEEVIIPLKQAVDSLQLKYELGSDSYVEDNRMRLHLVFPEIKIDDGTDKKIDLACYLSNSYDGSEGVRFMFGGLRLVCSNGLVIGTMHTKYYHRHTKGIRPKTYEFLIKKALTDIPEVQKRINEMQEYQIKSGSNEFVKLIEKLEQTIGKRITEKALKEYVKERQKNLWILYNAFTYILSHYVENRRIRQEKQMILSRMFHI